QADQQGQPAAARACVAEGAAEQARAGPGPGLHRCRRKGRPMSAGRVILQPRRARPFYGRHPWVYPGAISAVEGDPADGAEVDLVSYAGDFIARGLYNSQSKIRVRL